jgi:hypothetical protein
MSVTAQKIHKIIKDSGWGFEKSNVYKSSMIRGYHTRSYGYYLEMERVRNPDINLYKGRQSRRWLNTGRIFVRHTNEGLLPTIARVLKEAGIPCEYKEGDSMVVAGEKEERAKSLEAGN